MSAADAAVILDALHAVEAERARRAADPALGARVAALKRYQHARFERTYADLLRQPRYAAAARFFLEELYGPQDFSGRDAQFARIVPALTRLFPAEIVATVRDLGLLHALSESLDTAMAEALDRDAPGSPVDGRTYTAAWQAVGRKADRERQIALMLHVGRSLDHYTRNVLLRHSLRLMRGPARAAGLGTLQAFLESGFDTFRALGGAAEFLGVVSSRESALVEALFAAPAGGEAGPVPEALLRQLP